MKKFSTSRLNLSPQAEAVLKAEAPEPLKISAAKGLLPLVPEESITLQYALLEDPSPAIASVAYDALGQYPPSILKNVLGGERIHQKIIDWYVRHYEMDEALQEIVALNNHTSDETIALLAKNECEKVLEIIANNQIRFTRFPKIAENLFDNPALGLSSKNRVLSFYHSQHFGVESGGRKQEDQPAQAEKAPEQQGPVSLDFLEGDEEDEVAEDVRGGLELDGVPEELLNDDSTLPEGEEGEEAKLSLYGQIQGMNISSKIKLALKGNKEARGILIKSPNRLICSAVVKSPKISDGEVLTIAKMNSVDNEVIRIIASSADWTKNYQVRLALTQNPKTPFKSAMVFLASLREKEIASIAKSKSVHPAVAQQARRILLGKKK